MIISELFIIVLLSIIMPMESAYTSVLQIENGPIQGEIKKTVRKNLQYSKFTGIPYAETPVGNLRFKPPVKKGNWVDVFNATQEGNVCPQIDDTTYTVVGSEDCLIINVYTPHIQFTDLKGKDLKAVMIYFYGGRFNKGSASSSVYGPDFLIENDVIMVSLNYRLGPLGFLNINHENATGNAALKDQNLALRWVQENIIEFGGDPKKVTIFGHSAGSVSVDLHVLSDMSKGLFSGTIAMSGSPLWGMQTNNGAELAAFTLGLRLGTVSKSKDELLQTLYAASVENIILKANEIFPILFLPTIESPIVAKSQEKFLTNSAIDIYRSGKFNKYPYMTGCTTNEVKSFSESVTAVATYQQLLTVATSKEDNQLLEQFISGRKYSNFSQPEVDNLVSLLSEFFFEIRIDSKQQLMQKYNKYPIYYYVFAFESDNYWSHAENKTNTYNASGVGHGEDLPYVFYVSKSGMPLNDSRVQSAVDRSVLLMTNFAKYRDPTPNGKDDPLLKINWPASGITGKHLEINENLTVRPRPLSSRAKIYQTAGIDITYMN